jgi:predicted TPR repeat methyltransferase
MIALAAPQDPTADRRVTPMSQSAAENLFVLWDTYEKVVVGNYMFHREIAEEITRALRARFDGTAFPILDLGCGDAATFAPLLKGLAVARYKGVDLSQAALALAAKKLSVLRGPVELVHADIVSVALAFSAVQGCPYRPHKISHLELISSFTCPSLSAIIRVEL